MQALNSYWPFLTAFISLIVWSVRLEGKVAFAQKEISELKIKHDSLDSQLVEKISTIEKTLARIEGRLEGLHGKKN